MYWSWTFPWQGGESLLGILIAEELSVEQDGLGYTASLISLGIIIGRLDIIYNKQLKEEDYE